MNSTALRDHNMQGAPGSAATKDEAPATLPKRGAAAKKKGAAAAEKAAEPASGTRRRSAQPTLSGGLVSNDSLQEEEVEAFVAPEHVLQEEARLRQEREEQEQKKPSTADKAEAALDNKKFEQLEALLNRSQMYTQFLAEQMSGDQDKAEAEEAAAAAAKGRGKRKGPGGGGAAAAKKAKQGDAQAIVSELCPGFAGSLRDYQVKGVRWMISLYQNGINGILADQMGLGKTVQTIAFLCHLRSKNVHAPYMVLGPLSTLPNWVSEFERWAPDFPVVLYHGSKEERQKLQRSLGTPAKASNETFPVIVTSYEIAIADIKFLQRFHWKFVIVDEGHRLKNMNCKLIRELRTLNTDNKLLLTGTPLQNNLTELWSLLNFLLPDVFSSLENFESWFDFASSVGQAGADKEILAQEQRNKVISKLHHILKPFLLRRVKTDVETSLPGKLEVVLYAPMSEKQRQINQQLRDKTLTLEMTKMGGRSGGTISSLNNVLMQMRKCCNHPDLITAPFDGSIFFPPPEELVADCGKMALLDRLLDKLQAGGHKTLVFSQMTAMLDLMESYLDAKGIAHCRIDGSVSWQERQDAMRRFNSSPEFMVFLLSTRAGGLGINLTGADTVIIYDSDWNPHQDLQAMDRCHRIGQNKPVLVLRLATAHSVEGKMLRRANSKLALERLVIKKGAFIDAQDSKAASLGADELLDLLRSDALLTDVPQSGEVDDKALARILDRSHLAAGRPRPYAETGVGYEVVHQLDGSGLLQGVE